MRRRDFLKTTSAVALAAGSLPAREANAEARDAAAPLTLRLVTPWADAVAGPGDHVRRLAAQITAVAAGRWRVEVSTSPRPCDDVMRGEAELSVQPEALNVAHDRAFAWFAGLPAGLGLGAASHAAWIASGGGQELWDELAADFDMKPLLAGWTGAAPALWSRMPLVTAADLDGKRIAANGLAGEIAAGLGALPVPVPPDEVADALAAGDIDIALAPDASLATRRRLGAAAAHGYAGGFDIDGSAITFGMRRSFWDGLPASDRMLLAALAAEAFAASQAEAIAETAMAASLPAGLLAPLELLPAAIGRAIESVAASVVAEAAGSTERTRRVDHGYMAFRAVAGRRAPLAVG